MRLLKQIQKILIEKVILAEKRIQAIKRSDPSSKRIEAYRYVLFILKCFGDAIANIYISKHNLKQLSYNVENHQIRQPSGFISGRVGFALEMDVLNTCLEHGIPCVLCDITNNLRYGDICILVGADPFLVECKAGANRNQRARRQEEKLKLLGKFYTEDLKKTMNGLREIRRKPIVDNEVNYQKDINLMIQDSQKEGKSTRTVEKGLVYSVFNAPSIKKEDIDVVG